MLGWMLSSFVFFLEVVFGLSFCLVCEIGIWLYVLICLYMDDWKWEVFSFFVLLNGMYEVLIVIGILFVSWMWMILWSVVWWLYFKIEDNFLVVWISWYLVSLFFGFMFWFFIFFVKFVSFWSGCFIFSLLMNVFWFFCLYKNFLFIKLESVWCIVIWLMLNCLVYFCFDGSSVFVFSLLFLICVFNCFIIWK